jgi:beta-glucosidase
MIHSNSDFPKSFLWGSATAAHQVEGNCINNNWTKWEKTPSRHGYTFLHKKQPAGLACDHWNLYEKDIQLMKELGLNAYRFSVEWSKIEPVENQFDHSAIEHYSLMIDKLLENKITPMITLHHFTHPIWFEKLDAFEKEENIKYFLRFAKLIYKEYQDRVQYFCVINEPAVYTVQGYFTGIFPPEKQNLYLAAKVLKNLIKAHVRVYQELKGLPEGNSCKIGFVKNLTQIKPWRNYHPVEKIFAWFSNHFYNDLILQCLKTDTFKCRIPILHFLNERIHGASNSFDFIGLNYYSHNFLKFHLVKRPHFIPEYPLNEPKTDMPFTMYPQGFYDALKEISTLGKPIIVTENGIADVKDTLRAKWIKEYLSQLRRALNDGMDIRGYFYWSLMDNYEWAEGYHMKFGLYEVDFATQERKLREGAKMYRKIINGV